MRIKSVFMAVVGVASLLSTGCDVAYPRKKGKDWLEKQGYTNVTGGNIDYFNTCGKNVTARNYECDDKNGKHVKRTVCYGMLGPYAPIFE